MAIASSSGRTRSLNLKHDPLAPWFHIDLVMVFSTLVLAGFGAAVIYSSTRGIDPEAFDTSYLERQIIFVMVGTALMVGAAIVPYDRLRLWAPAGYGIGIVSVIAVLLVGVTRNGAKSWFEVGGLQVQPSEFLKIAFILVLASYVSTLDGELSLSQLTKALALAAPPFLLIMQQPDVGTALVFVAISVSVLLIGGTRFKHIVILTLIGLGIVALIWNSGALENYQQERLLSFIDPSSSGTGAAYQQTQAAIAIGSGGITGQGFGKGGQTRGEFVPEQHTDFIFTVIGEEFGFLGSAIVLGLFGLLIWRTWRTAKKAADLFGSLICVGVMTMIVFQMFQSVGMTVGIMPITGIPVPFLSYGGSSTLTSFIAVGLVLNVHMRRYQVR